MQAYLVEIIILPNKLFKLRLHIYDSLGREIELDDGDARLLEVLEEAYFGWL